MRTPRHSDPALTIEAEVAAPHALVGLVVGCLSIGCSWKFDFDLSQILASLFPNFLSFFSFFIFFKDLVVSGWLLLFFFNRKKMVAKFIAVACLSVLYFPFALFPTTQ